MRADLATALVTEMTDLAGTLGRHYALRSGVDAGVAEVRAPSAVRNAWPSCARCESKISTLRR